MSEIIAITGGIGSGKSIVSRIFRAMGFKVYDCDFEARRITEESKDLRLSLKKEFGDSIFDNDVLNRKALAQIVFNDRSKLTTLNSIIHPLVRQDILNWINSNSCEKALFIETAILEESNLKDLFNCVLFVTAPEELRVERVMKRNNTTREEVKSRIIHQKNIEPDCAVRIINDENHALMPQINEFIINYL